MKKELIYLLLSLPSILLSQDSIPAPTWLKMDFSLISIPYQADASRTVEGELSFKGILKGYANPGMQQSFKSTESSFLGKAAYRIDWLSSKVHPYMILDMKTAGWIAGNEFLDSKVTIQAGVTARLY